MRDQPQLLLAAELLNPVLQARRLSAIASVAAIDQRQRASAAQSTRAASALMLLYTPLHIGRDAGVEHACGGLYKAASPRSSYESLKFNCRAV